MENKNDLDIDFIEDDFETEEDIICKALGKEYKRRKKAEEFDDEIDWDLINDQEKLDEIF